MKKISLYILSFLLVTGCQSKSLYKALTSNYVGIENLLRNDGPPNMKKGLLEGCATAVWTRGNTIVRYNLYPVLDPEMILDDVYYFAWNRAYRYCFITANMDYARQIGSKVMSHPIPNEFLPTSTKNADFLNNMNKGGKGWLPSDKAGDMFTFGAPEGFNAGSYSSIFGAKSPFN